LWGIFDPILKNGLFDAWSFRFKKESFWSQELSPWCKKHVSMLHQDEVLNGIQMALQHQRRGNVT
jgi:hypothetical protein